MISQEIEGRKQRHKQRQREERGLPHFHKNHLSPKWIPAQTCRPSSR
jgi:hypothetical protein